MTEIEKYILDFKNKLVSEKRLSVNSLNYYVTDVKLFFEFFNEKKFVRDLSFYDLEEYINYCSGIGISNSTISRRISSVKCFYRYLSENKIIDFDISKKIRTPKAIKTHPIYLNSIELNKVMDNSYYENEDEFRDKLMIRLIIECGLKVSELINIKLDDLNLKKGTLTINKKQNFSRKFKLSSEIIVLLKNYINGPRSAITAKSNNSSDCNILFLTKYCLPMTRQNFFKILKKINKKIKLNKPLTSSILRHSFATNQFENGINLIELQKQMGYKNLVTTQLYTKSKHR